MYGGSGIWTAERGGCKAAIQLLEYIGMVESVRCAEESDRLQSRVGRG